MKKAKPQGVKIQHVMTYPIDLNGNPIPKTNILGVNKPPEPAAFKVVIRVETAKELTFMAMPGQQEALALAALNDPNFWVTTLGSEKMGGKIENLDKASMVAAMEMLRRQAEEAKKKNNPEGGIIH
jgi:hypothetical protein